CALHRRRDCRVLRGVAARVEDDHVRWPDAGAEGLQRPLVRLVRGLPRDREALVPALRDLVGGERAEDREHDPDADDEPASTDDHVREPGQHPPEDTALAMRCQIIYYLTKW